RRISFTPFDSDAAASIEHFETYNRTVASQRVADIVAAVDREPGAAIVAEGDAALAALLASAVAPIGRAVLDVGAFDVASDAEFGERLYIPGLRRAGDFLTVAAMHHGRIVVHNGGDRFKVPGLDVEPRKLAPREIVAALTRP